MCAHRSWAHLASDSFSTDENSKEENGGVVLVTSTTRSFSIPASHHKHTWNMAHSDFKQKEKTKKERGGNKTSPKLRLINSDSRSICLLSQNRRSDAQTHGKGEKGRRKMYEMRVPFPKASL